MTERFEEVECIKETDKALHCIIEGEACWVPKSQVHEDSEVYKAGDTGVLVVSSWWAEKAGLA